MLNTCHTEVAYKSELCVVIRLELQTVQTDRSLRSSRFPDLAKNVRRAIDFLVICPVQEGSNACKLSQTKGFPRRRKIARQIPINPTLRIG